MNVPLAGEDIAVAGQDTGITADVAQSGETDEQFDVSKAAKYSVANFGSSLVYGLFNTALPLYLKQYGVADWLIGPLANERAFVGALAQPIVGRLSDRTHTRLGKRRPFFLVGVPLMALSLFILAFHPDFWVMLSIMTVGSFFLAVAQDPYIALLADLFPEKHRGKVGGFLGLTTALGLIAFSLISFFLWESNSFAVFMIVIVVLLLTYGFTFFTVKEPPANASEPVEKRAKFELIPYVKGLLAYPEAAKYTFSLSLFWLGSGGATPFVTLFGTRALGASEGDVFLLPLAFVVCSAIFSIPAGLLSDRIGKKPVMMARAHYLRLRSPGGISGNESLASNNCAGGNRHRERRHGRTQPSPDRSNSAPANCELMGVGSAVWSFAQPLGSLLAGGIVWFAASALGEVESHDAYRWAFIFAGTMIVLSALSLRWVHPERATRESLEA